MICAKRNSLSNLRQLNLALFPIHVRGFVSGRRDRNKHVLARTDESVLRFSGTGYIFSLRSVFAASREPRWKGASQRRKKLKPYERYLVWATAILFLTATAWITLSSSPVSTWKRNPGFWLLLTLFCIVATCMILEAWGGRSKYKLLLWLLAAPVAVLVYEAWFFLKVITRSFVHLREPIIDWLILVWVTLTLYLWWRGNDYNEQLKDAKGALERRPRQCPHCGVHLRYQ